MLIKIISITFDSALGGFPDDEVRTFLKDKELISAKEYFFVRNDVPYLVFVLHYFPHRAETDSTVTPQGKRDESWRTLLSEEDMGLFNLLRDWRSKRCKKDGVPPYILFTNRQLALIVKQRPQSLTDLTKIEGIGQGKAKKYGQDILSMTQVSMEETS